MPQDDKQPNDLKDNSWRVPGMTELEYLLQYRSCPRSRFDNIQRFVDLILQRLQNFQSVKPAGVFMQTKAGAIITFHVITPTDNVPTHYLQLDN